MEVLINLFSKQLEMNGEYDGDLVIQPNAFDG